PRAVQFAGKRYRNGTRARSQRACRQAHRRRVLLECQQLFWAGTATAARDPRRGTHGHRFAVVQIQTRCAMPITRRDLCSLMPALAFLPSVLPAKATPDALRSTAFPFADMV